MTGLGEDQSAYRSELAGVIATLTILDVLVRHHNITEGVVTIPLDGDSTLIQSGGDWPLSVDQPSFNYLQVIQAWIKLSPLKFSFCYVKGHQTDLSRVIKQSILCMTSWIGGDSVTRKLIRLPRIFYTNAQQVQSLLGAAMFNLLCTWKNGLLLFRDQS